MDAPSVNISIPPSSSRSQIRVRTERLSQWRCVHSFLSFESPEEISAESTEPSARDGGRILSEEDDDADADDEDVALSSDTDRQKAADTLEFPFGLLLRGPAA
ncbi:uncharacterized protein V6R79_001609 [Siganus canaliculatus]